MNNKVSPIFVVIAVVYAGLLLISNVIAVKVIDLFGFILPAAVICYPLCWIISDVLTEVYGFKRSFMCIKCNAIMNIVMVVLFTIAINLPSAIFWEEHQIAFETILGVTWRICIFSIISNFVGDYANSIVLSIMKVKQHGKSFGIRSILSSMVGQFVDCGIFITGAFYNLIPSHELIIMFFSQYIVKIFFEICLLPITIRFIDWLKKIEGDYYDDINVRTYF